jgi:hypothetical protein
MSGIGHTSIGIDMNLRKLMLLAGLTLLMNSTVQTAYAENELRLLKVAEDEDEEEEQCPEGFEESEERCTPEEREEGCRDIRLDNGKGCVDRDN